MEGIWLSFMVNAMHSMKCIKYCIGWIWDMKEWMVHSDGVIHCSMIVECSAWSMVLSMTLPPCNLSCLYYQYTRIMLEYCFPFRLWHFQLFVTLLYCWSLGGVMMPNMVNIWQTVCPSKLKAVRKCALWLWQAATLSNSQFFTNLATRT